MGRPAPPRPLEEREIPVELLAPAITGPVIRRSAHDLSELPKVDYYHPFWHFCRRCWTFGKFVIASLIVNAIWDFATFEPIHRFYEIVGWIK